MSLSTADIRKKFLDFFAARGHTIVPSDSLVPKDDPTVLFTTAGMQQFKRQFLGHIEGYTRAATAQKCLRTDDLEEVGRTDVHHTFFEMLGNFSFGDYFKKEAIGWAWEFLTKELALDPNRLWVSVHNEDQEAKDIWLREIGLPARRLVELGDHSNFWPADAREKGPNGPCGPCSEIFYDYGAETGCQREECDPACDCGRFSEVWNLVFTQYNRQDGGRLEPLPNKNIDTGMGLERLAAVLQGKKNNFDIDLFAPIFRGVAEHLEAKGARLSVRDRRVIADHIRAVVFSIVDGVVPSNEGRGYVVKKLIIDMTDIALKAGMSTAVIYRLVPFLVEAMGDHYSELGQKAKEAAGMIRRVEEAYIQVRRQRIPELRRTVQQALETVKDPKALAEELGKTMFVFKDTYGLTLPTIEEEMRDLIGDEETRRQARGAFESLMRRQQEQSRAGSKMTGDVFTDLWPKLDVPPTRFIGYDRLTGKSPVLGIVRDEAVVPEVTAGEDVQIILRETPFYAESGGQVGDQGELTGPDGKGLVTDTRKVDGVFIHDVRWQEGTLKVGDQVTARVDQPRREAIQRHHTATHILQAALRRVLGDHVRQQGSLVDEQRLRFDFTHPQALSDEQIRQVEAFANQAILRCDPVRKEEMPLARARESGALAFFAEKYGETVRVVSVGDYSKEFCGGTHVDQTGQIGLLKVTGEQAIAQGIRRLEACCGLRSLQEVQFLEQRMSQLARLMKAPEKELLERARMQIQRLKALEKEVDRWRWEAVKVTLDEVWRNAREYGPTRMIARCFKDVDARTLRRVGDYLKQKSVSLAMILGAVQKDAGALLVICSEDITAKGVDARDIIAKVAPVMEGSGGGRPQMAQAGSRCPVKVRQAMDEAAKIIQGVLEEGSSHE